MFGWRKKRDGFEWHDYVRTTILVRRAKRRQKVDDARAAAVDGLKDAGAAAAHGLNEAKGAAAEGFRRAGEMGQARRFGRQRIRTPDPALLVRHRSRAISGTRLRRSRRARTCFPYAERTGDHCNPSARPAIRQAHAHNRRCGRRRGSLGSRVPGLDCGL